MPGSKLTVSRWMRPRMISFFANIVKPFGILRDWPFITGTEGGGGGETVGGGASEVIPVRKWGGGGGSF